MDIYSSIYNLLLEVVFGGSVVGNSAAELSLTLVSLICCLFMISIPFIIVFKVIKIIMGA